MLIRVVGQALLQNPVSHSDFELVSFVTNLVFEGFSSHHREEEIDCFLESDNKAIYLITSVIEI
ncbi:hypothetical protein Xen7305DRAFT_00035230 [Xenococcus sp. PCC 7305]|nr:hypothetical protein Xen7305DRAFT_00035230 [Xenococcus sp. PCC 7305]